MNKFALGDKPAALKKLQELWTAIANGHGNSICAL